MSHIKSQLDGKLRQQEKIKRFRDGLMLSLISGGRHLDGIVRMDKDIAELQRAIDVLQEAETSIERPKKRGKAA